MKKGAVNKPHLFWLEREGKNVIATFPFVVKAENGEF